MKLITVVLVEITHLAVQICTGTMLNNPNISKKIYLAKYFVQKKMATLNIVTSLTVNTIRQILQNIQNTAAF